MKSLARAVCGALALGTLVSTAPAVATVDALTAVHLVIRDVNSEEFMVRPYTLTGCYGVQHGPQAAAFTEPFTITAPRGCGMPPSQENVNALTCATADYQWDKEVTKVIGVTVNVRDCKPASKGQGFREAIRAAARLNFGQAVAISIVD